MVTLHYIYTYKIIKEQKNKSFKTIFPLDSYVNSANLSLPSLVSLLSFLSPSLPLIE